MPRVKIGIIGGSGLCEFDGMTDIEETKISTPFGDPSDTITVGRVEQVGIAFLPRHGRRHRILPSEVPARANIYALKSLGAEYIIAVNSEVVFKKTFNQGT